MIQNLMFPTHHLPPLQPNSHRPLYSIIILKKKAIYPHILYTQGFIFNKADTEYKYHSVLSLGVSASPRDFGLTGVLMVVQFHLSPTMYFLLPQYHNKKITYFILSHSCTYSRESQIEGRKL